MPMEVRYFTLVWIDETRRAWCTEVEGEFASLGADLKELGYVFKRPFQLLALFAFICNNVPHKVKRLCGVMNQVRKPLCSSLNYVRSEGREVQLHDGAMS